MGVVRNRFHWIVQDLNNNKIKRTITDFYYTIYNGVFLELLGPSFVWLQQWLMQSSQNLSVT